MRGLLDVDDGFAITTSYETYPGNFRRRRAKMPRARLGQFLPAAIAVEHADGGDAVLAGADHVVAAVADHQALGRIRCGLFQRVGQQVDLSERVPSSSAPKRARNAPQSEMVDDAVGIDVSLAGGDEQPVAGRLSVVSTSAMPS